jgi:CRISPR-associated protein Cas5h
VKEIKKPKEAISFELSGSTGFFKKPDVNVNTYFTYNNIHKIALLGLLGAIIGLEGHTQQNRENTKFPEFYEKLHKLKVAIEPKTENGYFIKKIQAFNNSVGYASKEEGGNLIVREQWLENPCWHIYILDDDSIDKNEFTKLKDYILNNKCVFIPYLGKNDHPAVLKERALIKVNPVENVKQIDTLFKANEVEIGNIPYDLDETTPYLFKEYSPYRLNEEYNFYEFEKLYFTNLEILDDKNLKDIYSYEHGGNKKILAFI